LRNRRGDDLGRRRRNGWRTYEWLCKGLGNRRRRRKGRWVCGVDNRFPTLPTELRDVGVGITAIVTEHSTLGIRAESYLGSERSTTRFRRAVRRESRRYAKGTRWRQTRRSGRDRGLSCFPRSQRRDLGHPADVLPAWRENATAGSSTSVGMTGSVALFVAADLFEDGGHGYAAGVGLRVSSRRKCNCRFLHFGRNDKLCGASRRWGPILYSWLRSNSLLVAADSRRTRSWGPNLYS
jgi:hypothetical protein